MKLLLLLVSIPAFAQVSATKNYVDAAISKTPPPATIPKDAVLPGSPTTTTQPAGTNNTTVATTEYADQSASNVQKAAQAYTDAAVTKASSILLYSGATIQGSQLASGQSETATVNVAGAKVGSSCTLSPTDGSLPPQNIREFCRVTAAGVVTITRRNDTSDPIQTSTLTYSGAVLQ